jgi:flagellar biosynthesis protein FlhF
MTLMKISKFTGADLRQALRIVLEQLGADAVILSSRRVLNGVEITAAIDHDVPELQPEQAPAPVAAPFEPEEFVQLSPAALARASGDTPATVTGASSKALASVAAARPVTIEATGTIGANAPVGATALAASDAVNEELRTLRRILETQVAQLAWNDLTRRAPIHTEVLRELTQFGFTPEFASQIVAKLPTRLDLTQARRLAIASASQQIPVTGDRWLDAGGRVALVGPTGVGKTTTLAKIAVRWVLRHGSRDIALVSADSARIGAHDTVVALGQMLGVNVHSVDTLAELPALLRQLANHRLVLIDTPGLGQRDTQLAARLAELAAAGSELEIALVLAASTQAGALEEIVSRFAPAKPASCLLTKVDEAASLGGVLSVLSRANLPISYTSEGQRVPEDLRPARALELVSSAVQLAQASGATADEDLLRRRFGDIAHALA